MDTATVILIAKGAIVLLGLAVVLAAIVKEYERMGKAMAEEIALAALERGRKEAAQGSSHPRVTLSPASDAHDSHTT